MTNVRGPEGQAWLFGCPILQIIPLSVAAGNVTVSFAALSYADSLTITLIADPDTRPDLKQLRDALDEELRAITVSSGL